MSKKLILGTVQFGLNYGINNTQGKPEKEAVFEILSCAFEKGIRYLDTAELYGNAHELIGEFHNLNPSKIFHIITKFPHDFEDRLDLKINTYLKQLNVETIHAILFHSFESYLKHKEQLRDIVKLKSNKVKNLGVSVYTNAQMNEVLDDINIDIIQIPFNVFDNLNIKGKLFQKAKAKNKYRCSICGETKALQVHHLRYKNLYDIKTSDLRILCDTCHSLTHKLIKTGELSYGKKNRKMFKVMRRKVLEEKKGLLLNKELDSEFSTIVTN